MPTCYAAKDHAVQQRVASKTIVTMDTSCNLTRAVKAWDGFAVSVNN
jgi:hypothetical protein